MCQVPFESSRWPQNKRLPFTVASRGLSIVRWSLMVKPSRWDGGELVWTNRSPDSFMPSQISQSAARHLWWSHFVSSLLLGQRGQWNAPGIANRSVLEKPKSQGGPSTSELNEPMRLTCWHCPRNHLTTSYWRGYLQMGGQKNLICSPHICGLLKLEALWSVAECV